MVNGNVNSKHDWLICCHVTFNHVLSRATRELKNYSLFVHIQKIKQNKAHGIKKS